MQPLVACKPSTVAFDAQPPVASDLVMSHMTRLIRHMCERARFLSQEGDSHAGVRGRRSGSTGKAAGAAAGEVAVLMMTEGRGFSNAKAKRELGWELRYSSWREGFKADLT